MRPVIWLKSSLGRAEHRWFDLRHGVKTARNVLLGDLTLASGAQHGHDYIAARPANVREALSRLPVDHSRFTFVDLGSGKGPVLFMAARYPYRRILGVEFAQELHLQAKANIATFHSRKQRCGDIQSLHLDVRDFVFPEENLVLYLFNPFPPRTLEQTLANLHQSLMRQPREVLLLSLFPDSLAPVFQSVPWLSLTLSTARYQIYHAAH